MKEQSIVLKQKEIEQKTERIAFEIYENSFEENEIVLIGISGNGFLFAERLARVLGNISDQKIELCEITVNKDKPLDEEIIISVSDEQLTNKTIVLVDDVINSGRTMIYAVKRILKTRLKSLQTAVLVNRTHRKFPVQANFVGLNIATTLKDSIIVELGEQEVAYLA